MRAPRRALMVLCLLAPPAAARAEPPAPPAGDAAPTALAIFERRILPIFRAEKPSSCTECHLSGVDLRDYIDPDQAKTFASLVRAKLVDVQKPEDSKILEFIARKPEKPGLIGDAVRRQEYDAFRAWLEAAVKEPALLAAKPGDERLGPTLPDAVVRHARSDRVLASFIDNVWAEVGRCVACHSPDRNAKVVAKHGGRVSWIRLGDPEATMKYMLDEALIDLDDPAESPLLTKPTLRVEHGGGQKMVVGDRAYKQFRAFIDDYAAVVGGSYTSADQLPGPSSEVAASTDVWLKIENVPARFDAMLLQVDLYRWEDGRWSKDRWASSDRPVFGKGRLWQHTLSLTAPRGSARASEIRSRAALPPGRYLARILVDQKGDLTRDFRKAMNEEQSVAAVEFESRWPEGYDAMTVVRFPEH